MQIDIFVHELLVYLSMNPISRCMQRDTKKLHMKIYFCTSASGQTYQSTNFRSIVHELYIQMKRGTQQSGSHVLHMKIWLGRSALEQTYWSTNYKFVCLRILHLKEERHCASLCLIVFSYRPRKSRALHKNTSTQIFIWIDILVHEIYMYCPRTLHLDEERHLRGACSTSKYVQVGLLPNTHICPRTIDVLVHELYIQIDA